MKSAARIVSVALALSAIVAMPFAQPAHAVRPADLQVRAIDNKVFSDPNTQSPIIKTTRIETYFSVMNNGGSESGTIFVEKWCRYNGVGWVNVTDMPITASMLGSLDFDEGDMVTVNCRRSDKPGQSGPPTGARVKVRATLEPESAQGNNMDEMTWSAVGV